MRKGLYPIIAGVLIALWLLAKIFETQINAATPFVQDILLGVVVLVALGAVVLAMWDAKVIGRKDDDKN